MKRYDIINHFINIFNYDKYLEIGVHNPSQNFDQIDCKIKHGVDPLWTSDPSPSRNGGEVYKHVMDSDKYFRQVSSTEKYDIIFIDGLHLAYQVTNDYHNAIKHLSENGTIIFHDCSPPTAEHAYNPVDNYTGVSDVKETKNWNGDCYKAYLKIRLSEESKGKEMYVVDTDWGVGILRKGAQRYDFFANHDEMLSSLDLEDMLMPGQEGFDNFDKERNRSLNLITPQQFKEYFDKSKIVVKVGGSLHLGEVK